jgi:hypothetical protein
MTNPHTIKSGIRDNRKRGSVGDYLKQHISAGSELSFVSAYFTIYAFNQLKEKLGEVKGLRMCRKGSGYASQSGREAFAVVARSR